jgi:circadian clock protein KaiC
MNQEKNPPPDDSRTIRKVPTQIKGLDVILHGGLPAGRTSLVSGGPGSGKSLVGLEFLYRGALSGHPGLFVTFEENGESIRENAATLGWDLEPLEKQGALFLLDARVDPETAVSGEFNLKGLLAVLEAKTLELDADRIVFDALDGLMRFFSDPDQKQNQILVLHRWLTGHRMTAVLTSKTHPAPGVQNQSEFLDFLADCVISLDQEIKGRVSTKMLRVVKYRGSAFGGNAYPFLVTDEGLYFQPITTVVMHYDYSTRGISSGNERMDQVLGGGFHSGRCTLISGETGTGKTCLACTFVQNACDSGDRVLYVNYEESPRGMMAGMKSLGIDLEPALGSDRLRILSLMPESLGMEEHLFLLHRTLERFRPDHLVLDAISACKRIAGEAAAFDFLVRVISTCREQGITALLINQVGRWSDHHELTGIGLSSIIDAIVTLDYREIDDEIQRRLLVLKARGTHHSGRCHRYRLTDFGMVIEG